MPFVCCMPNTVTECKCMLADCEHRKSGVVMSRTLMETVQLCSKTDESHLFCITPIKLVHEVMSLSLVDSRKVVLAIEAGHFMNLLDGTYFIRIDDR